MSQSLKIEGSLLLKNTALNFIGQIVPLVVAVVAMPYIIHGLGVERFGILSLTWVVLGYFSLFDLGLGRATTKFVAEELGKGETENIPTIVWTSLAFISFLGLVGITALIVLTPFLVEKIFNIPHNLIEETKIVFYISSAGILVTIITASLSGVLQAYQRFDLVNMLNAPSNILSSIISVIAIFFGAPLPIIVTLLVIKNIFMLPFYLFFCIRVMPSTRNFLSIDFKLASRLFTFGGWITVINVVSPVLTYIDRFLIASLLSVTSVAYYTPPYTFVSKLWILPTSLFMTLFPAFSMLGISRKKELERLFTRSLKHLMLLTGPIILILVLFAEDILHLWLGSEFAARSTLVFQVLAIGFFLNCQAWIPSTLLQGIGRPDVVAKLFLFELPLYVGLSWWLIGKMGIEGAALAWAFRGGLEVLLFFIASWKVVSFRFSIFSQNGVIGGVIALGGLVLTASIVRLLFHAIWLIQAIVTMGLIALFVLIAWRYTLDAVERREMKVAFLRFTGRIQEVK